MVESNTNKVCGMVFILRLHIENVAAFFSFHISFFIYSHLVFLFFLRCFASNMYCDRNECYVNLECCFAFRFTGKSISSYMTQQQRAISKIYAIIECKMLLNFWFQRSVHQQCLLGVVAVVIHIYFVFFPVHCCESLSFDIYHLYNIYSEYYYHFNWKNRVMLMLKFFAAHILYSTIIIMFLLV